MDLLLYKDSNAIIPICTTNIKDFVEGGMTLESSQQFFYYLSIFYRIFSKI